MQAAGIDKMEVVGVIEQAPGHKTTGDDGPGVAEASNWMARGNTGDILPLVLFGAAALHVATVVLVEPGARFYLFLKFKIVFKKIKKSLRWLQILVEVTNSGKFFLLG